MVRDSFLFYRSFYEAVKDLPTDIKCDVYDAIMEYGLNGIETAIEPIQRSILTVIKPFIDKNNKRRENGMKGGQYGNLGGNPNLTPNQPQTNPKPTPNKEGEKDKEEEKKSPEKKAFVPPTASEVADYCKQIGSHIDAAYFMDYYKIYEWKVNGKPMKNWKLTVQTWTSKDRQAHPELYRTPEAPKQESEWQTWKPKKQQ